MIRIQVDNKFAYWENPVDSVADLLDTNTRVGAIEVSCELTKAMLWALGKIVEHDVTEN